MKVKMRLGIALLIACLPWLAMAQNDDLYFVPKKEKKAETKTEVHQVTRQTTTTTTTTASVPPATTVVVKDVTGKTRDIDEYNRRYTSRENTFSMQNDTLYIEEKPYGERGEWVNGFEGSQDDYEYAMRIVRFRSPAYAIPISSPLYWDVVYGAYPSWDWNVYDDGLYAYVFPTFSNPLWWDWRWNWSIAGPRWGYGWGWHSPWYYWRLLGRLVRWLLGSVASSSVSLLGRWRMASPSGIYRLSSDTLYDFRRFAYARIFTLCNECFAFTPCYWKFKPSKRKYRNTPFIYRKSCARLWNTW